MTPNHYVSKPKVPVYNGWREDEILRVVSSIYGGSNIYRPKEQVNKENLNPKNKVEEVRDSYWKKLKILLREIP